MRALIGLETLDIATPEGYLNGRVFALVVPLLFLIFSIGFGARTVAGEEQRGTLELVLATPIARWRVVVEKLAAMVVSTALLGVVLWASLVLVGSSVDLGVGPGPLGRPVVMAVLLAITFGALALGIGCATGRRSWATGIASGVAVGAYVVKAFAPIAPALETFEGLSPFYYYDAALPLVNGIDPTHVAFFLLLGFAFTSLALVTFDRRDLGV
ncbi:MAG: ABC transporter permease [Actinomycetota bacterium]